MLDRRSRFVRGPAEHLSLQAPRHSLRNRGHRADRTLSGSEPSVPSTVPRAPGSIATTCFGPSFTTKALRTGLWIGGSAVKT